MLKDKLIQLLREFPSRFATADGDAVTYEQACDDGAEDIQAVVIQALREIGGRLPEPGEDENIKLLADDLFSTVFGASLFNFYTLQRGFYRPFLSKLYFSSRKRVVAAMLVAMIKEEQAIIAELRLAAFKGEPGE
jgi:hypothetical protein